MTRKRKNNNSKDLAVLPQRQESNNKGFLPSLPGDQKHWPDHFLASNSQNCSGRKFGSKSRHSISCYWDAIMVFCLRGLMVSVPESPRSHARIGRKIWWTYLSLKLLYLHFRNFWEILFLHILAFFDTATVFYPPTLRNRISDCSPRFQQPTYTCSPSKWNKVKCPTTFCD